MWTTLGSRSKLKKWRLSRSTPKDHKLPFLDCAVYIEEDRSLNTEVYRKPTHTNQYLLFHSHHPLEHKLAVIRTLHYWAESVPTKAEGKQKEHQHWIPKLGLCRISRDK